MTVKYWLICLLACVGIALTSCDKNHDDWRYGRDGNNTNGYGNGGQNDPGDKEKDDKKTGISGSWGGKIDIELTILGWTFEADESYILFTPNKDNKQIGEGELVCFYDDTRCPVVQENIFFTWYLTTENLVITVPCDNNLNCTIGGLKIQNGKLTGVMNGKTSCILDLAPIDDFDGWNGYNPETGYQAYYRNIPMKGQWMGAMGTYYDGTNTYDADHTYLRFLPSTDNNLKGTGEEIDFYNPPCPVKYESFYFEWEVEDGMLYLTFPWNEDLNLDLYDVILSDNQLLCQYDTEDEPRVIDLKKLTGYNKWYLYDSEQLYGVAYYESAEAQHRKLAQRSTARSGRRNSLSQRSVTPPLRRSTPAGRHRLK